MVKKGNIPWNKGLTKIEDDRLSKCGSHNKKGKCTNTGRTHFKKGQTPWNKNLKGFLAGKKHYNWQGGKSFEEYGSGWNNELRKEIRKRDKWQCQRCNCKDKEMTVHHIDYSKKNNSSLNLITLCRHCHMKMHIKSKRYYWNWQWKVFMNLFHNAHNTITWKREEVSH